MEIKIENLSYQNRLEKINLTLKSNEITSIIGKNGIGKTCILDLIYDMNLQDGTITIDNNTIGRYTKKKELNEIRRNMSYLMEDYNKQLFNINVLEDIKYGIRNFNSNKLKELLKQFDLDESILSSSYFELSTGEKKKILLISILLCDSSVILLDNPTSNLDNKSIQSLIKLLKRLKRDNKIVLITSIDPEFLLQISDRIIVIDNKKIISDGNKYEILSNRRILNKINIDMPEVIKFENTVLKLKNINLGHRDNINDLIKDIYRNVK